MVLELNVARLDGVLKGETPEAAVPQLLRPPPPDRTCSYRSRGSTRSCCVRFTSQTVNWVNFSLELLERLSKDWDLIRASLAAGAEPGSLTSIAAGAGDTHRHGRTVAILEFSSWLQTGV